MVALELDDNQSLYQIRAYRPGYIQINDQILTKSVIVTPFKLLENWFPQTVENLTTTCFDPVLNLKPDVLLIGTGSKMVFLSPALYGNLINHGIGVELMDTGAACRTFNALSAENRHVAAALILI